MKVPKCHSVVKAISRAMQRLPLPSASRNNKSSRHVNLGRSSRLVDGNVYISVRIALYVPWRNAFRYRLSLALSKLER